MEANIFFITISVACIALVGYFIWLDNRNLRMLRLRVKKLHASAMFAEMTPLLKNAQKRPIEQLIVDKTGIIIRYLEPAGSEAHFLLREHGYPYFSIKKQETLIILLEEFLPKIADTHRYSFRKKRTRLINKQVEIHYQYTIHSRYKTSLVRAPYYDGSLQHLWQ